MSHRARAHVTRLNEASRCSNAQPRQQRAGVGRTFNRSTGAAMACAAVAVVTR
jgi:hypothetical protein